MGILDQLETIERTIAEAEGSLNGDAATRIFTVYKHVLLYLIETEQVNPDSDAQAFWDYVHDYTPAALYKVACYHRKQHGYPRLNYTQSIFHLKENTMAEHQNEEAS